MDLEKYYNIYKTYYDEYVTDYLKQDLKKYPAVRYNLKDVEQELAVKYFTHIKFICENNKCVMNRKNYSITFLKDKVKDMMLNQKKQNKQHRQYTSEKKEHMMSNTATLYTILDSSHYSEFKEIIVKTLTFRESSIL